MDAFGEKKLKSKFLSYGARLAVGRGKVFVHDRRGISLGINRCKTKITLVGEVG